MPLDKSNVYQSIPSDPAVMLLQPPGHEEPPVSDTLVLTPAVMIRVRKRGPQTQSAPCGPVVMEFPAGPRPSVIVPAVVIRASGQYGPTNHSAPSGPVVMSEGRGKV